MYQKKRENSFVGGCVKPKRNVVNIENRISNKTFARTMKFIVNALICLSSVLTNLRTRACAISQWSLSIWVTCHQQPLVSLPITILKVTPTFSISSQVSPHKR